MARDACLIVNPHAGGGRAAKRLGAVEAATRGHGLRFRVERTASLEHARELTAGARERGEVAAAMGGDGLMGAVAGELCGTDAVLGVVPAGRGNDFARKLGVSEAPEKAVGVIAAGAIRTVDVAFAGDRPYLGVASAGLDSDVQVIANRTRLPLGDAVYLYGTLRALSTWKPADWTVTLDGETRSFRGYAVAVANSGVFGGGMQLVPHARMDDGLLDVVLNRESSKRHFLAGLTRVFRGAHVDDPTLTFLRAREVAFHADRPFTAFADGDPIAELPATFRVVERALRVLAP
ncbi:MAG: diacylglycerol/lipid kinase family protein [Solirubrobacteraceae bacterium]